jgi:hypothetical protein
VVISPVRAGILPAGTIPDARLAAFRFVRLTPLTAGS